MKKLLLITLLILAIGTFYQSPSHAQAVDHLLITEIVVTPTNAEFIEIYNPTSETIDLTNYFLFDGIHKSDPVPDYANIVDSTDTSFGTDFTAQFPAGATIDPGEFKVIALKNDFSTEFGFEPDFDINPNGVDDGDAIPDMLNGGSGIGSNSGLTNSGEVIVLFYWDGVSDLVQDVDIALWGDKDEAVVKTGAKKDSKTDADEDSTEYFADTPVDNQDVIAAAAHVNGKSWQRIDLSTEGSETLTGGNGITGHDETSENLSVTWTEADPSPKAAFVATQHPVTFQCNMDIQMQMGAFDPAVDKLVVRGSLNGWAGEQDELTDPDGDKIYTVTVNLDESLVGTVIEFKYVLIPSGGGDQWENVDNRTFTLLAGGQILDVVYFNNQEVLSVTAMVTFQADMSDMLDKGWFDPSTDSMRVVGGMNGWANTESMEPDPFDPSLYVYDIDVTAETGSDISWKFRAYPTDNFLDGGWEAGENHVFTFEGTDLVLDPLKPNVLPGGKPLAQDVTVRFSVDVNDAVDWYNKQPFTDIQSVWVTGDWNNWGGSWSVPDTATLIRLYDDGITNGDAVAGDGVWTTEVLYAAGTISAHLYKYSIYGAGVDTLNGGTSPMDNEAGFAMNHVLLADDTNPVYILPEDIFGSQWKVPPTTHPVTFQCNMDIQMQMGAFDPAADKLVVRGSFNGWSGEQDELTDPDGDKIYTLTVEFADSLVGESFEYKHVLIPSGGGDQWENVDNRTFTLLAGGQILDVVYFNNQEVLSVTAMVTFQADMSDMLDKGWFDPSTDSMRVVGGMNGWANTESMEPDPFDPSLYVYDIDVTGEAGSAIYWKFRAFPTDNFLDGGWEAGDNHVFTFTGSDLVLDPLKPGVLPGGKPLAQDVTVRFSVDVNDAVDWYNKQAFPDIQSVWVTGDWNNWGGSWSVPDTATLVRMYDDGVTNGDAAAGDGIWTTEVLYAAGTISAHLYKYSIYGAGVDTLNGGTSSMDNEAGFAMNHVLLVDDTNPLFVPATDLFGGQYRTDVDRVKERIIPTEYALGQNYPNPFNPSTEIMYALPKDVKVNLSIYNSLGQRIATLVDKKQSAGTYRAIWDARDVNGSSLTSGVYFYRLEAGDFVSTMKMLFIK